MKWRKVADQLEKQAKSMVSDEKMDLLAFAPPETQMHMATARLAAGFVLAAFAAAIREGISNNNFPGGK